MNTAILDSDAKMIKREMSKNEKLVKKGKKHYGIENMNDKTFKIEIEKFAKENNLKVKFSVVETYKGNRTKAVFNTTFENCNAMQEKAGKIFWQIGGVMGKMQIINNY